MREDFEWWYLRVVKGHPNNLLKDESGGYKHLTAMYLGWEVATLIERQKCKRDCREVQQAHAGLVQPYHVVAGECIAAIEKRSNVEVRGAEPASPAERPA